MSDRQTTGGGMLAIDAHVHLHDRSTALAVVDRAGDALRRAAGGDAVGILMLAERRGTDIFPELRSSLLPTADPEALWRDSSRSLLVLSGYQIVTSEGLEILALATLARPDDGEPAERVIGQLEEADAIVVLPWGVGKWLGRRGRLVEALAAARPPHRLFIGDNRGRPWFWPLPRVARERIVLPGSDPLPLPGREAAAGTFGFKVAHPLPHDRPATALKRLLRDPATRPEPFGRRTRAWDFFADQLRMRLGSKAA